MDKDIGNLIKIDPRTGAKSSSAPLLNNRPPRMRSSASRSDVGDDLMEIDYNKSKYSSVGIDLCDSFTIEPVGRSRSGSYSSSSHNALKMLHERDKIKLQPAGHSSSSVNDSDSVTDYLTMSPLNEQGKANSKASVSNSTPVNDQSTKKTDTMHPPGDYVSLDPTCTYNIGDKFITVAANSSIERTNIYPKSHSSLASMLPKVNNCDNAAKSFKTDKETSVNGGVISNSKDLQKQSSSDYMCMNYEQNLKNKEIKISPNIHSLSSSDDKEYEHSVNNKKTSSFIQQDKELKPISPSFTSVTNFVPKTPPPSPSYGPVSTISGLPFVDNVVRRLSQPGNTTVVQHTPGSRPNSVCGELRLNYASLDLPPASEDDAKGTAVKLKKSTEDEVKEISLTYAQIDFSPVRQKAFQESETLSHL